jgi:hypothetical protein
MRQERQAHEEPFVVAALGWRYHHLGIPTTAPRPDEVYLPHLKIHVAGFETSPFGIEWMRFDPDCRVHELVRTVPHLAFEVDDLEAALAGRTVISPISSPSAGVRVAMIEDHGSPVELMEFRANDPSKI